MVVSCRYDLAALDYNGSERKEHRALRCSLDTLGQIELRLVHTARNVTGYLVTRSMVLEEADAASGVPSKTE
jgi:hypothetical protein